MGKYPDASPKDHFVAAGMIYFHEKIRLHNFTVIRFGPFGTDICLSV
jgi:hypothetical protein